MLQDISLSSTRFTSIKTLVRVLNIYKCHKRYKYYGHTQAGPFVSVVDRINEIILPVCKYLVISILVADEPLSCAKFDKCLRNTSI